jgi:hypothetical protein
MSKKKEKTPTWKFIKNSSKNLKNTGQITSKGDSPSNERSRSIEQNPTYLKNLRADISNPNQQGAKQDPQLNNFYVVSTHQSYDLKPVSEGNKNNKLSKSNNPEIGVEEFSQSMSSSRNK